MGGAVALLSLAVTFLIGGGGDALGYIIPATIGVGASLVMPTVRTWRGRNRERQKMYLEQIQPVVDEYEALVEDRERDLEVLRRKGRPAIPSLQQLDEDGVRVARRQMEEIKGLFDLVVSRAVSTLGAYNSALSSHGDHAYGVIGRKALKAGFNLSENYDLFRLTLAGKEDMRRAFLNALGWYLDVRHLGHVLSTYPVQIPSVLRTGWDQNHNEFWTRFLDLFAISELEDLKHHAISCPQNDLL